MSNSLLHEIQDDIVKQRYIKFFKKYGFYLIIFIISIIVILSLYLYMRDLRVKKSKEDSVFFLKAVEQIGIGNYTDSATILQQIIEKNQSGYSFLSRLNYIALLLVENKTEEAIFSLKELIIDKKADYLIQNLSKILLVQILLFEAKNASVNEEVQKHLDDILQDKKELFYYQALLLKSHYNIIIDEKGKAIANLQKLLENINVNNSLKAEAELLLLAIGGKIMQ